MSHVENMGIFLVAQDMVLSHRAKFKLIINFFRVKAISTGLDGQDQNLAEFASISSKNLCFFLFFRLYSMAGRKPVQIPWKFFFVFGLHLFCDETLPKIPLPGKTFLYDFHQLIGQNLTQNLPTFLLSTAALLIPGVGNLRTAKVFYPTRDLLLSSGPRPFFFQW